MSAIVKETSEYVEMSDSITLCIVKDGAAGTSINMKTGVSSPDALPSSGASVGDSYIIDGHLWTYTGGTASDATHRNGFTDCGKVSGEAGKNNYVHVAWSNKQNPTKDDIVLSNTDGNAYAYMGTWVSETKEDKADEAVNMAKWVYVKGDKGDTPTFAKLRVNHSALHYNPSTGKWDYDSVTVTIVIFTSKGTQIPDYGDTKEYYWLLDDDTTVKRSSGMGFSATLNAASHRATLYKDGSNVAIDTITVPMVRDGQDGQGADGKGALEIICDPETIVLDTDDNGLVNDTSNAWAALMCVRDGKVVDDVTYDIGSTVNCEAIVNNVGVVKITKVNTQTVTIDGNTVTVSSTSGSVTVSVTENATGVTYTKTVPFTVNVAKYTGGLKADNKKFESAYNYLTNNGNSTDFSYYESKIRQTAKEISLKVSEKSVGRRNMLVGSACRKYGDGFTYMSGSETQYYDGYPLEQIEINSGIDGVNCIHCRTKRTGTDSYYLSGFRWWGISPQGNIKLEKGKNYVLSFYAKTPTPNDIYFIAEVLYQGSKIDTSRPAGYEGPTGHSTTFSVSEANKWELFTVKVSVPSNAKYEYEEINIFARGVQSDSFVDGYICKPMLEEGEEYNGWTLSEQDYDYVGGNLLDGTGTLTKTGNVEVLDETTVKQDGYNNESASVKAILLPTMEIGDFLQYSTKDMGLKVGEDCMLSFYARAASGYAPGGLQCYLYSPSTGIVLTESSHEKLDFLWNPDDGHLHTHITPTTAWKRYWVHWRPMGNVPQYILFRLVRPGTNKESYDSSTSYNVGDVVLYGGTYYVCQKAGIGYAPGASSHWEATEFAIEIARPKLEVGATMTEWTEKRADMVDKQALYATGIDIKNRKIIATADNFVVQNNRGTPTFSVDVNGNIVGSGGASFNGPMNATTFTLNSKYFSVKEDGTITATGGQVSFFRFDAEGMASPVEYDSSQNKPWRGIGFSSNNISVSGYTGQRISSVFLGKGLIDSRFAGSDKNYIVHRVGSTSSASTFYNYIKLERFEDGHDSYENDPEYAALGIETQGDFCLAALGGPSLFAGMCFASNTVGSYSADKKHCFYLCEGGTFKMPSDPPNGMLIVVIQTGSRKINFEDNVHGFQSGTNYSQSCNSNTAGQWTLFYYDGWRWNTVYMNGRPW